MATLFAKHRALMWHTEIWVSLFLSHCGACRYVSHHFRVENKPQWVSSGEVINDANTALEKHQILQVLALSSLSRLCNGTCWKLFFFSSHSCNYNNINKKRREVLVEECRGVLPAKLSHSQNLCQVTLKLFWWLQWHQMPRLDTWSLCFLYFGSCLATGS